MAESGQSVFAEPMSMSEALQAYNTKVDQAGQAPQEVQDDQSDEPEQEAEAEADAAEVVADEKEETPESEQDDDGPQVLTADEYGDILVKVGDSETTLSELISGNLRQSDYSRKTAELAQERKSVREQVEREFAEKAQELEAREKQLDELLAEAEQEPDWAKLAEDDPLGYAAEKERWAAKQRKREAHQKDLQKRQQQAVEQFQRETAQIALEKFPEWGEGDAYAKGVDRRKRAAMDAGFTEAEFNQAFDHRLSVILEKAARYDEMSQKGQKKSVEAEKKIAAAPKVLKPGAKSERNPQDERRAKIQKQIKSGTTTAELRRVLGR